MVTTAVDAEVGLRNEVTKKDKSTVSVRTRADLRTHELMVSYAEDAGMTVSTFAQMLLRQAVRNWEPDAGKRKGRVKTETRVQAREWPSKWPKSVRCFYSGCQNPLPHDPITHRFMTQADVERCIRELEGGVLEFVPEEEKPFV